MSETAIPTSNDNISTIGLPQCPLTIQESFVFHFISILRMQRAVRKSNCVRSCLLPPMNVSTPDLPRKIPDHWRQHWLPFYFYARTQTSKRAVQKESKLCQKLLFTPDDQCFNCWPSPIHTDHSSHPRELQK